MSQLEKVYFFAFALTGRVYLWARIPQSAAQSYELVGLSGRFAPPLRRKQQALRLRRHRSYGSPHRVRMAQGQSSKDPLRLAGLKTSLFEKRLKAIPS